MASLRYDNIHNELNDLLRDPEDRSGRANFEKATARIGVSYTLTSAINLFANWGQGFLPPATEELAQNPDNFGGFNAHLTSATSNGVDAGIRGSLRPNMYYDFTCFYLSTENDFDRYRIPDPLRNQETFYRNAGSSRRFGLELYSRYSPVESVELQLAYTYSNFSYTNMVPLKVLMDDPAIEKYVVNGNRLPNSPHHQMYVDCLVRLVPEVALGLSTETLSKTYIDGANVESEAADGYTLIHARVTYEWSLAGVRGVVSAQGRNLGNVRYLAFTEPDPGGNAYQPGAGREFFARVRLYL
jgi:iron complex outermembrane receptor protein